MFSPKKIVIKVGSHLKREIMFHLLGGHPEKIVYDHLPKCAGSTLNAYLDAQYPKRKIFSIDGMNPTESVRLFKSMTKKSRHEYCLVKGHLANELFEYVDPACLKVTVLRNPVDRIISHFFYAKRTQKHYLYSRINSTNMCLEDYADSNLSDELKNWYTTHFSGLTVDEVEKNPAASIEKAAEILLERYNVIGFLEDFPLFVGELRDRARFGMGFINNQINATKNRPSIDSVSQAAIEKIELANSLDIALYQKVKAALG
jgi:hypothetical protein